MLVLGWAGGATPAPAVIAISQVATAYYFAHFLMILPLISRIETPLPLPNSISESVLHGESAEAAPANSTPGGEASAA